MKKRIAVFVLAMLLCVQLVPMSLAAEWENPPPPSGFGTTSPDAGARIPAPVETLPAENLPAPDATVPAENLPAPPTLPTEPPEMLPPSPTEKPVNPGEVPAVPTEFPSVPTAPAEIPAVPTDSPAAPTVPAVPTEIPVVPPDSAGKTEIYNVDFWVTDESYLSPAPITASAGESVRMPDLAPAVSPLSGMRFVGWAGNMLTSMPDYRPGASVPLTQNLFLYSVFAPAFTDITYRIGINEITVSVPTGGTASEIPALPEGYYSWEDATGSPIDPAKTEIWNSQVFIASTVMPMPEITPPPLKSGPEHTAFLSGFSDGLFHPERSLTRAQAAKILWSLLDVPETEPDVSMFTDVPADAWYAPAVSVLYTAGIAAPDENGAFRGNDPITRGEFAVFLAPFVPNADLKPSFPDVTDQRADFDAVGNTAAAGLFSGNDAGLFQPDNQLNRAQAAVVFNRLLGRTPNVTAILSASERRIFPDVPSDFWAYGAIMEAAASHTSAVDENGMEQWLSVTADPVPLKDGFYQINSRLYRVSNGRFLASTSDNSGYTYDENGRSTTGNDELDTFLANIIAQWTNDSMTRDQKLRALFNYVRDHYTYLARDLVARGSKGWENKYALDFFRRGKGNCYSFAAAYYLLVRQLGLNARTVLGDIGPVNHRPHGWVEIVLDGKTWCFDTELEMAYRRKGVYSYNLYHFTYSSAPFQYFKW